MNIATDMVEFEQGLQKRANQYAKVLPSNITPDHFQRVAVTAVTRNPKLLNVDRQSLWNALMQCAQDGLLPDGRNAVIKIYKDKAGYERMIGGWRKLVQQSGEITRFEQTVVYSNDEFSYRQGDQPRIDHVPYLGGDRGEPIVLYSIAQFPDGTLSREVMTVAEVEGIRAMSPASDGPAWTHWWSEMARKTVAKRHAKILPVSSEARAAIDQDNADFPALPSVTPPKQHAPETGRPRLAAQFDALGEWSEPSDQPKAETEKRTRGRPRKAKAEAPPIDEIPDTPDERLTDTDTRGTDTPDELAGQMDAFAVDEKQTPDYEQGRKDAAAGRVDCLNSDIKGAPYRYREWKRGFASVKR